MRNEERSRGLNILVVEDNPVDVEAVKRGFDKFGIEHELYVAGDGIEALRMLREQQIPEPFLVLLDLNMPRMNGGEFLRELRADENLQGAIVFVLTTSNAPGDRAEAYAQHVAGYVVKGSAGADYRDLNQLIESFSKIVEFPCRSHCV